MAKFYDSIPEELAEFIRRQHVFFVASAPLSASGRINISPKGMDTFRILSANRVAYLDLTGSGNETSAHLSENGRITFMFCAFEGKPMILRLYGSGRTVLEGDAEWAQLKGLFPDLAGARQIIVADVTQVQTSCGYAVPFMDFKEERDQLVKWCETKGKEKIRTYWREKNVRSIDGLPTPLGRGIVS
jgi:hypothetical protein